MRLRVLFAGLAMTYAGFLSIFLLRYFFMFNPLLHTFWNPGLPEMISRVNAELDDYDRVFVTPSLELGYTYFSYYTPFDPQDFQTQAKWRKDGFLKVDEYGKYKFSNFPNWNELLLDNVVEVFDDQHKKILIVGRGEAPKGTPVLWEQTDWRGRTLWYAFATDLNEAIYSLQTLSMSTERSQVLAYLVSCQVAKCEPSLLLQQD
jgi:hypothetical protein